MKRIKDKIRIFALMTLAAALILTLAACSSGGGNSGGADDGQNPVMNFVGVYAEGRANIFLEADGDEGAKATVTWGSSAWETSEWQMSGTFDADKLQFEYHDCVKTDYKYAENGDIDSQEEVYTGGHGFMKIEESDDGLRLTWQDDQESIADGTVFSYIGAAPDEEAAEGTGEETGAVNPWKTADSAEAAAGGAGLDGFDVPDGDEISIGPVNVESYGYMDGLAEARIPVGAVEMTIRKGKASAADVGEGDISGDYGEYKYDWTQNIKGLEVKCFGNRKGEATKTIWGSGDELYSITAFGAGGDEDFGLNADDLSSLINAIQ